MDRTPAPSFTALAALVLVVTACGTRSDERSAGLVDAQQSSRHATGEALRSMGYLSGAPQGGPAAPATAPAPPAAGASALDALWARQKLIREARVELQVDDVDAALERIERVASEGRGFVAGSELRRGAAGGRSGSVTLKVPSGSFDEVLSGLREIGEVRHESTSTQDVTKAYADLETRLAVKRRTKERLDALLASRTGSLDQLLKVERELERVVTQIEQMLGEKRYYDQRIAVSTITVSLFEPGTAIRPGVFDPVAGAARDAAGTLAVSLAALIYVAVAVTPWVLLAALLWSLIRRWRRRRRAARSEPSGAS